MGTWSDAGAAQCTACGAGTSSSAVSATSADTCTVSGAADCKVSNRQLTVDSLPGACTSKGKQLLAPATTRCRCRSAKQAPGRPLAQLSARCASRAPRRRLRTPPPLTPARHVVLLFAQVHSLPNAWISNGKQCLGSATLRCCCRPAYRAPGRPLAQLSALHAMRAPLLPPTPAQRAW